MSRFLPAFHFVPAAHKLTEEWCIEALNYCYYSSSNMGLLDGKNVNEIETYSNGSFDMEPFKRMFKSMKNKLASEGDPNMITDQDNIDGLDWKPLPLIPVKLNTAVSTIHKIPVEVTCRALDPLAAKKKQDDLMFMKMKPLMEDDLQPLADEMQIGKVDLGATTHSAVPYSDSPYGMDLNEPDELDVFVNLIYTLGVEAAYETVLQQVYETKNAQQVKKMETYDQYKFGVSVNRVFLNPITGLHDIEYVHPSNMNMPDSQLPDFSDNPYRFMNSRVTAMEMFNFFNITDPAQMNDILNGKGGYTKSNNISSVSEKNWGTFKVDLVYCEIKSVDWVGINKKKNSKRGFQVFTSDEALSNAGKIWGQNTYTFWWIRNTNYVFDIKRLPYAAREKGKEAFQTFSTNIYRSQKKSAIELAIPENKKAQKAEIKVQHAIIKSLPSGKYIDLRFLRSALAGLQAENSKWTIQDLINLAFEQNILIGDTEGFEGKNDGQWKPLIEIVGGLKEQEVGGYLRIIAEAKINIGDFTGINDQLTGQSPNPDALVGTQKLLINSSINALSYVDDALKAQYTKVFNQWANDTKECIEAGGKRKEAIIALIGQKKANLIDRLDESTLHRIGVVISMLQREVERQRFEQNLQELKQMGVINSSDEYMLSNIPNPRDAMAMLAVREKQYYRRQEQQQQINMAHQQSLIQQQGKQQQAVQDQKIQGNIREIYAKGDVQAKIIELAQRLGLNAAQFQAIAKQALQDNRTRGQIQKSVQTLREKANLDQQSAVA
jgi:hypothetical protein